MVESVDKLIYRCGCGRIPSGDLEDFAQDCRLALWKVSETFSLDGSAKWSTYAYPAIVKVACRYGCSAGEWFPGSCIAPDNFDPTREAAPATDHAEIIANAEADPDEVAGFDELTHAIRNQAFAEALASLSPGIRRYLSLAVLDGLDAQQIAMQTGIQVKVVHRHLAAGLSQLAKAGRIPPELARKVGIDVEELAASRSQATLNKRAAENREKVAALRAEGLTTRQISERLGLPETSVHRYLQALRRPPKSIRPPLELTSEISEQIQAGWRAGLSQSEIAKSLGVGSWRLQVLLSRLRESGVILPARKKPVMTQSRILRIARVRDGWERGLRGSELADLAGCSLSALNEDLLFILGPRRAARGASAHRDRQLKDLAAERLGAREIAERLGLSVSAVGKRLQRIRAQAMIERPDSASAIAV